MVITHRKQCWLYMDDIGRLAGVNKRVFTSGGKGVNFHKNKVQSKTKTTLETKLSFSQVGISIKSVNVTLITLLSFQIQYSAVIFSPLLSHIFE